ncbi:MAG TPA: hypothetical protein VGN16_25285 [Acidobacteriaceae bacterium]|jgi:hypothetical protein
MAKTKRREKEAAKAKTPAGSSTGEITILGRSEPSKADKNRFLSDKMIKLSDYLYEKKVKTSTVKENLTRFLTEIGDVVAEVPELFGSYELDEIEVSAELTISGEFKLIGLGGGEVEGKGGLKFTIRRNSDKAKVEKPKPAA